MGILARTTRVAVALFVLLLPMVCRADVAPEYPHTAWDRDQAPSRVTIIAVGAATSAAIVTLGLYLIRRPGHTATRKALTTGMLGFTLLVVLGVVWHFVQQAERDRHLWKEWEEERQNRRRNWQGPPQYEQPPQPATSEATP